MPQKERSHFLLDPRNGGTTKSEVSANNRENLSYMKLCIRAWFSHPDGHRPMHREPQSQSNRTSGAM